MSNLNNNDQNSTHEREFAWRVFAGEYNASTLELSSDKERSPKYLVTELGAKINRIYVVGVLTEVEKLERNGNIHYRARISDRTGVFHIYAGQYDPEVVKALSKLEAPAYVAVIGKSRRYSPSEGVHYVSIRPESVIKVDKTARDYWFLDACKNLKTRIEAVVEAQQMAEPDLEKLVKLGYDESLVEGVMEALGFYEQIDLKRYRDMLVDVLKYLAVDNGNGCSSASGIDMETIPTNGHDLEDIDESFKSADELADKVDPDDMVFEKEDNNSNEVPDYSKEEERLLVILRSCKGKKFDNGVPWHELVVKADSEGLDKNIIEDIVNNLLNTGKIYEPMLGKIKCTS